MSEIAYFDANASFGRSCARLPGAPYDLPGLIAELDHCRISRALVFHAAAREQDSRRANGELIEAISGEKRLAPQMVLNPGPWSPERDLNSELDQWLEQGVRAFRIFPRWHVVDLFDSGMRKLLAAMAAKKLPLWLDYDQFWYNFSQLGQHEHRAANLAEVARLAGEYSDLPVVACGVSWSTHTQLFPLLDKHPNLLVETSLFQGFEAITLVCSRWGAERLLFGTGQPVFAPGAARAGLAYADISDNQKQQIASGNLEKLLGEKPTTSLPELAGRSSILVSADRGEPLGGKVAIHDSHGHIAPVGVDGINGLTLGPQDGGAIVQRMDRLGFKSMCVSSWEILGGDSIKRGNMDAARAAVEYPGRILPYAAVNPNYPEDWDATVTECFERRGFFGFKPYPTSQRRAISHPVVPRHAALRGQAPPADPLPFRIRAAGRSKSRRAARPGSAVPRRAIPDCPRRSVAQAGRRGCGPGRGVRQYLARDQLHVGALRNDCLFD